MTDLHNIITGIENYDEYCFRPNSNSSCASTNILEAFGFQKKNLVSNILRRIETIIQNDAFLMSNGRRLLDNFNQIFGNTASINSINSTNALRIVYFMKEHDRGEERREGILEWEEIFLNKVSSFSKNTTCANVFYAAERSLDDSVEESTGSDIKFFAVTFVIMGILSGVVNGRCADARYGHQLLGFSALLSIYLGVTSSLGFLMLVGVPFISMVGVLPFLVVSIGIDDVFIILHELNEMIRQDIPANHILSGTMARSGPTITMTTLTDLVAFAVSCRSIFPSIRIFCTYAALAISSVFVLLLTFFVGCMWFDIKRINAGRRDFLPWLMSPPPTDCCSGIRRSGLDNVMKAWGKKIVSPAGKTIIFLSSLLLLSFGIYGARSIDESFNRKLLTTEDSHYREFLKVYEENFHLNIEVSIIFTAQADQSSNEIKKTYSYVENLVENNEYFDTGSISWLSEYISWAQKRNIEINNTRIFHAYLQEFISIPKYQRFAQDLKFSEDKTHLKASRILVYSRSDPDSTFQRNMMASIRKDLLHSSNVHAFAVALPFIYFEQYARVLDETIRNLIVAGISIILISCLFLNHFVIIFCLIWGFVALIFELLGLMYIWNVSLNSISMINLIMALGFSVDYNAHVAFHFVSSKATTPELRVIDALHTVGGSVFLGGLSTFLGMMPTGFTSSTERYLTSA
ncbi:patched domain-containing protein 3-like [Dendronephthya gigantea]|uniref:patched domain-containing protein 3-like n=1 Tax=Dendronephthya gigantea TaxID=151771 RepID=UPI0010699ADA|nr:patched domain-containing protein 3-like [Dendronephthya gigantea]